MYALSDFQVGIEEIFYIDPYPGISESHILNSGVKIPKLTMFSGAIGRAYHQIYEPIMPIKDEICSILKIESKNYYKLLKEENEKLKEEIEQLKKENENQESNKSLQRKK